MLILRRSQRIENLLDVFRPARFQREVDRRIAQIHAVIGAVVLLRKQYGRVFIESLPNYRKTTEMRVVEEFFGGPL